MKEVESSVVCGPGEYEVMLRVNYGGFSPNSILRIPLEVPSSIAFVTLCHHRVFASSWLVYCAAKSSVFYDFSPPDRHDKMGLHQRSLCSQNLHMPRPITSLRALEELSPES
jgi:hypothetical protein